MKKLLLGCLMGLISISLYAQTIIDAVIPKGSIFYVDQRYTSPTFPNKKYEVELITNKFKTVKDDFSSNNLSQYKLLSLNGTVNVISYNSENETYSVDFSFKKKIGLATLSIREQKGKEFLGNVYFANTNSKSINSTGKLNHQFDKLGKGMIPSSSKGIIFLSKEKDLNQIEIQVLTDIPIKVVI